MKKLFLVLTVLVMPLLFIACSDDDDKDQSITFSEVPKTTQAFLKEHFVDFNEADIQSVTLEGDGSYDIKFKNRIEMDFYPNGVWKDIDLNGNALPQSIAMLLPEKALTYLSSTYPGILIEEVEKTGPYAEVGQGYKIELRNDREIYFDAQGNVLKDKTDGNGGKQDVKFEDLLPATKEFLTTYFKGQTPTKIEKEWNTVKVEYNSEQANEVEIEFFSKDGSFYSVEVETVNDAIRAIIKGVSGSDAILVYLDKEHTGGVIEEFSIAASGVTIDKGYVVEVGGKPDYKIYFDIDGKHLKTLRD